jgi:hypothetical protein
MLFFDAISAIEFMYHVMKSDMMVAEDQMQRRWRLSSLLIFLVIFWPGGTE